ncbi:Bestrophin, RFP-TM, chloride channel-domain-containing protein [Fennellomyces sp. T-0311]|nr:Bestrophin, RFP-TM, chloride channel-domain-containing protein [Fennellomyces sp. T-0311]
MAHVGTPYEALLRKPVSKSCWQRWTSRLEYPDVLRWRGSVLLNTLPGVFVTTFFSCIVCIFHLQFGVAVGIPVTVLSTVSVALGLLLAFRVNTAYDRYWEGRKLIQTVMATVRNLTRQVWINIPEQTHADHVEKMRCIKLLLAFMVATKHHLRGEYGTDYDDLKELLPAGWQPCSVTHAPTVTIAKQKKRKRIMKSVPLVMSLYDTLRPSCHQENPLEPDDQNDVVNIRRSAIQQEYPDSDLAQANSTADVRRMMENDEGIVQNGESSHHHRALLFTSDEDLPSQGDADIALPLEILFLVALYVNQAKRSNKIESNFVSVVSSSLDTLVNTLTAFERISNTPVPKAYNIHLKQGVILYIFFLPFALVDSLAWLVAPIVALVSFTLFGIEAIGAEIENPFGYDYNDLPLNSYCEELKQEVAYIIYHIPTHSKSILLDGH